ncbi:MAG: diphthine--ammonia ligase [Bacteroidota bacterium]|nr:diphthine--ammonia ligase [Bacteroidota bacterium]
MTALKSFFNWSGGKDSTLALYHILKDENYSIEKLLTNINSEHRRISMHGVREELLELQAAAIGIPLKKLVLPDQPSMTEYEEYMMQTMNQLRQQGYTHSVFGDIFLEDLKKYRETQLAKVGMTGVFPIWKRGSAELIHEFIDLGFKTIVVCVNEKYLDKSFCGRIIDENFIADLPGNVDVCGENGEFHTFAFDGPLFKNPVTFSKGEIVYRKYAAPKDQTDNCFQDAPIEEYGFYFCDLLPQ